MNLGSAIATASLGTNAETVATFCFFIGAAMVVGGTLVGLVMSWKEAKSGGSAKQKVNSALQSVKDLKDTAAKAAESTTAEPQTADSAKGKGAAAESALKEIEGIIGSLPERMRFVAMVVLIGALLMSVATVQFGGHSIF